MSSFHLYNVIENITLIIIIYYFTRKTKWFSVNAREQTLLFGGNNVTDQRDHLQILEKNNGTKLIWANRGHENNQNHS